MIIGQELVNSFIVERVLKVVGHQLRFDLGKGASPFFLSFLIDDDPGHGEEQIVKLFDGLQTGGIDLHHPGILCHKSLIEQIAGLIRPAAPVEGPDTCQTVIFIVRKIVIIGHEVDHVQIQHLFHGLRLVKIILQGIVFKVAQRHKTVTIDLIGIVFDQLAGGVDPGKGIILPQKPEIEELQGGSGIGGFGLDPGRVSFRVCFLPFSGGQFQLAQRMVLFQKLNEERVTHGSFICGGRDHGQTVRTVHSGEGHYGGNVALVQRCIQIFHRDPSQACYKHRHHKNE